MSRPVFLALVFLALALGVIGCSSSSSPTSTTPPTTLPSRSTIAVSVDPSPIVAGPSSNPSFSFEVRFTVTARETAGLACNLNLVNWTMRNATTGIELNTLTWNPNDIIARAGRNHVPASGSLSVPLSVVYTLGGGGRQALATIVVQAIDANGNTVNGTATVNVL